MLGKAYKSVSEGAVTLLVKIDGKEIDCLHSIVSVNTENAVNRIARAEIVLTDGGYSNKDFEICNSGLFNPGKDIEIALGYGGDASTVFKGIIIKNSVKMQAGSSLLVVEARHKAILMTLRRKTAIYSDKTDSDIIAGIVQEYGIGADICPTFAYHESLAQYNVSDWDFINLRAEACGLLVQTVNDGLRISAPDPGGKPSLEIDGSFSVYDIDASVDARKSFSNYTVRSWNYTSQEMDEESSATGKYDTDAGSLSSSDLASALGSDENTLVLESYQENPDAMSAILEGRIMRANLARVVGKATIPGYELINPGDMVSIEELGDLVKGGNFVSAVKHKFDGDGWMTTVCFGLDDEPYSLKYDNISAIPADGVSPAVSGLQIAKVEQLADDPLGENRILIRLVHHEETAYWARIALLDAGNERGTFFLPEIGDEVIVGFVDSNPGKPVVLGMLHSSQAPTPVEAADENNIKGIYTREKIKLEFDDDKKAVTIETPGGNSLIVSDDAKGISLTDQNGNKITLDDSGITIESAKAMNIKAKQDITVEGANVNIKANMALKAEGGSGAELSTNANAVIKGSVVQIN